MPTPLDGEVVYGYQHPKYAEELSRIMKIQRDEQEALRQKQQAAKPASQPAVTPVAALAAAAPPVQASVPNTPPALPNQVQAPVQAAVSGLQSAMPDVNATFGLGGTNPAVMEEEQYVNGQKKSPAQAALQGLVY